MKEQRAYLLVSIFCVAASSLHAAPTAQEKQDIHSLPTQGPKSDSVVSQLEGLKVDAKDKELDSIANHEKSENKHKEFTIPTGLKPQKSKKSQPVIPDEASARSIKDEIERRLAIDKQMEILQHYSPLDLALYIIRTGDEEGVSLVIQELLEEGMITTDEALEYLHKIRGTLQYYSERDSVNQYEKKRSNLMALADGPTDPLSAESDYESMLERFGDKSQNTQQGMEEIIYQLAKLIFYRATERDGEAGSQTALREISLVLAKEVERGAISVELEKKILELVVGSLVDSFNEEQIPSEIRSSGKAKYPQSLPSPVYRKESKLTHNLFPFTKLTVKREANIRKN